MRKVLSILLITWVIIGLFSACSENDDFSSDTNLSLTFSTNTVSFDTLFTNIGSATKQFKIYNKNDKSLVINSITLMNPEKSGFRMNIDGEKGTSLSNIEILKKDSLFGFIEVTVDIDAENPVLIRDSIRFETNGNIQYLQLQAVGQNVYIWKGERVTQDTIISSKKPLLVFDSIVVNKDAKVTFAAGSKVFFKDNASLRVYGVLNVEGTVEKPVIFRGERFDNIEGNIPYNNVPGQWDGIYFHWESFGNTLQNLDLRNATRGMTFYAGNIQRLKARLTNVMVRNCSEYGVSATSCNIEASNCLFANSRGPVVSLNGGNYTFLHCTIANYYKWSVRTQEGFTITNSDEYPITKCDIINSIIYGSVSKELKMTNLSDTDFEYRFINCLIKATEVPDPYFTDVIWAKDPLFVNIDENGTYSYDFLIQTASPATGKANSSYSANLPYDIKGMPRTSSPSIGCYEPK